MRIFTRMAFISTLGTYLLIFLGGLVRVSGAGLGCPDWPKCFGRWIPPTSISQLPRDMDPALFNFALAWIEYINRLVGALVGLSVLLTGILALVYFRKKPSILIPSVLAVLLVAFQGWQGGQVVESELNPTLVSTHMIIAFIIVGLLIFVTVRSFIYNYKETIPADSRALDFRSPLLVLGVIILIQTALGTQIRGGIELLAREFPLLSKEEWLSGVGFEAEIHYFLGLLILIAVVIAAWRILAGDKENIALVQQAAWGMILAVIIQVTIGGIMVFAGLPSILQLFHLWMASLLFGFTVMLFSALTGLRRIA